MKNIGIAIVLFTLLNLIFGIEISRQNNDEIKIASGSGVDGICIGQTISKKQLKKYGKIKKYYFKMPIKPRIRSYRIKSFGTENSELFITTIKNYLLHKYKVKTITVTIPLKVETEKGIKLGISTTDNIIKEYGEPEGKYMEIHEIDFAGKKGKLVKHFEYYSLGISFFIDSIVYKIEIYQPGKP